MESQNIRAEYVKKISKVNLALCWGIVLLIIIFKLIADQEFLVETCTGLLVAGLGASIVYFLKVKSEIKGLITPAVLLLAIYYLFYVQIASPALLNLTFIFPFVLVALYFNPQMLLTFGGIFNLVYTTFVLLTPALMLGPEHKTQMLFARLVIYNSLIAVFYFLTRSGNQLINSFLQKEQQTLELLSERNLAINGIAQNTEELDHNITQFHNSLQTTIGESERISRAIEEMAKGVEEQANGLSEINDLMNAADRTVEETDELSRSVTSITGDMRQVVIKGTENAGRMNDQMLSISRANEITYTAVLDLRKNMDEINKLLMNIGQIGKQTNLLALNASIEAARAGESGRGFAVVAKEVQELAAKSRTIVDDIQEVMEKIVGRTTEAVAMVGESNQASREGSSLVVQVQENFVEINQAFNSMDEHLNKQMAAIAQITDAFTDISQRIENIAGISEEHSATAEEMISIILDQNQNFSEIAGGIDEIRHSSRELRNLFKNQ